MGEIKVGEFVRTKDGIIAKVTDVLREYSIDCDDDVFDIENGPMMEIPWEYIEEYIVNHSFNIIKLLGKGDYVNGIKVKGWFEGVYDKGIELENGYKISFVNQYGKIETILTKEQYERNCYRLEDN